MAELAGRQVQWSQRVHWPQGSTEQSGVTCEGLRVRRPQHVLLVMQRTEELPAGPAVQGLVLLPLWTERDSEQGGGLCLLRTGNQLKRASVGPAGHAGPFLTCDITCREFQIISRPLSTGGRESARQLQGGNPREFLRIRVI